MNILRKIWSFEVDEGVRKQPKIVIIKILSWFLAIVIMFTVVSRAADSLSLAVVRAETASGSVIVHEIRSVGVVESGEGTPIILPSNSLITETVVKDGDVVSEGDLLVVYDISEIKQSISEKQISLSTLQEQLNIILQQQELTQQKEETVVGRKGDDSLITKEEFSIKLNVIGEKIRIAKIQLSKYEGIMRDDYNDEDYSEIEYNQLKSNVNELRLQYEQVEFERDQALLEIERAVEDVRVETPDASEKLKRLEMQQVNLELSVLYGKIKSEGKVYAAADGIIKGFSGMAGKRIASEDIGYIIDKEYFQFVSEVSEEEKKLINVGDKTVLEVLGERTKIANVLVTKIEPMEKTIGSYKVTSQLPDSKLKIGDSATMIVSKRSQKYDLCVELSSLYSEGEKHHIFVIEEAETVLGLESTVQRVEVTLLDKNEKSAAIKGAVSSKARIVNHSDKPINSGDRVRVES